MTYEKRTIYTNGVITIVDAGGVYADIYYAALDGSPEGSAFDTVCVWDFEDGCRSSDAERRIIDALGPGATEHALSATY